MAERSKKISELDALTNASGDDLLIIVDQPGTANAATNKITVGNFFANVNTNTTFKQVVSVGANLTLNTTAIKIGNSTVNTTITAGNVQILGSTLSVGNSTVNTTINSGTILIGNSSVNASINATGFYINGAATVGPQGSAGAQGPQGSTGAQGSAGAQGPQGSTGAQGSAGAQGDVGAQGSAGAQGPQGSTGAQGSTGSAGAPGADSIIYTFETSTTDSNPTTGFARLNNNDRSLVTEAYLSKISNSGANSVPWMNSLVASTNSPNKSIITFGRTNDFAYNYARYYVTGLTDAVGYVKLSLTYIDHIGTLNTNGANLLVGASRIGDVGAQGSQGAQGPVITIPGPYTDDAAAAANGVSVGSPYYQVSGAVYIRLT